ncbi:MAG TPA: menaquinone biosynthesis decarboxylase, partial [Chitinophagaceae bacterium]
ATIVGIPPQEDAWLGKATERIFLAPMKMTMVPEIVNMDMPVEGVFHNLVIAQIHKEYAGQGQKVMNAMWGAGQMMFNKILVLADEGVNITDYKALAQYVFKNINPLSDVVFSQGPMDVLDHSCSKLGFGGKMCIDGTAKYEEETDEQFQLTYATQNGHLSEEFLKNRFREIKGVNTSLLHQGIPCLIISLQKDRKGHVRELHQALAALPETEGVKMILYVEQTVDAHDIAISLWRFCNNLDPRRDSIPVQRPSLVQPGKTFACLGLDGTRKTREHDNFQRDWPNIIVADDATIVSVDKKWDSLGLGPFIASPSLKFKGQLYGNEAVVNEYL